MNHIIRKTAAVVATAVTALLPFAYATPAFAAAPNWDTTGAYTINFELGGGHYVHDLTLVQTGASLAGNGGYPAGVPHTYTWVLTSGSVDGDTIDFLANYTASADAVTPQTTMHVTGTIAPNGTMSGTWSDNYQGGNRVGTWVSASGAAIAIAKTSCSTVTLSSDTGTTFKGLTTVDPVGSSADALFTGGTAGAAVVTAPDGYPGAWDTAGNNPLVSGASWVNNIAAAPTPGGVGAGQDSSVDTWRLFSESFTLPAGATVSSASVNFSADNSASAYYDNAAIGSVSNFQTVVTASFGATAGTHELEFVTKNDAFGAINPTAVIYKATINYCVTVMLDCPAAPAVANKLLKDHAVKAASTPNFISAVAHQMGPDTKFNGVIKCNTIPYRNAVDSYLHNILHAY